MALWREICSEGQNTCTFRCFTCCVKVFSAGILLQASLNEQNNNSSVVFVGCSYYFQRSLSMSILTLRSIFTSVAKNTHFHVMKCLPFTSTHIMYYTNTSSNYIQRFTYIKCLPRFRAACCFVYSPTSGNGRTLAMHQVLAGRLHCSRAVDCSVYLTICSSISNGNTKLPTI